jgi:hypothetical protein
MKNTNDVFGFQKAINFDKLNDPKILDELSRIFKLDNETPQSSYKKAVNTLKRKVKNYLTKKKG